MWGNLFIVTLVTYSSRVSSSGVSRGIHHKCKHPLNPTGYMYPDESSRVLVYWFESHNMLGCCMYVGLWKYTWLHDENLFGSSLPFAHLIACMLFFYFCDDHQFIDGSICERYSWAIGERGFRCIVHLGWTRCLLLGFSLGLWPMYQFDICFLYVPFKLYNLFSCGTVVCLEL